ncbi:hypothetical protein QEN19_003710 [Hanseniaspora menglaensis]
MHSFLQLNYYKTLHNSHLLNISIPTRRYLKKLSASSSRRSASSSALNIPKYSIFKLKLIQNLKIIFFIVSMTTVYNIYDLFVNKNEKNVPLSLAKQQHTDATPQYRDLVYDDLLENEINLFYLDNVKVKSHINNLVRKKMFIHPEDPLVLSRPKTGTSKKIGPVDQRFNSLKINIPSEFNKNINWYNQTHLPVKYLTFSYLKQNSEKKGDRYKLKISTNIILTLNPINLIVTVVDSIKKGNEQNNKTLEKEVMYMPNNREPNENTDGGLHFGQHNVKTKKFSLFLRYQK